MGEQVIESGEVKQTPTEKAENLSNWSTFIRDIAVALDKAKEYGLDNNTAQQILLHLIKERIMSERIQTQPRTSEPSLEKERVQICISIDRDLDERLRKHILKKYGTYKKGMLSKEIIAAIERLLDER